MGSASQSPAVQIQRGARISEFAPDFTHQRKKSRETGLLLQAALQLFLGLLVSPGRDRREPGRSAPTEVPDRGRAPAAVPLWPPRPWRSTAAQDTPAPEACVRALSADRQPARLCTRGSPVPLSPAAGVARRRPVARPAGRTRSLRPGVDRSEHEARDNEPDAAQRFASASSSSRI